MADLYTLYRLQQAGVFKAPAGSSLAAGINFVAQKVALAEVSGGSAGGNGGGNNQSTQPISRLDQFITEEGGLLPVFYGEHLIAGTLIAHKYTPSPADSIFAVAIGEGELGDEGIQWYAGQVLTNTFTKTVWVEDAIPTGATAVGDSDGWNWISGGFSGTQSHVSPLLSGVHQHYFQGATATLSINTGDWLYTYIYLDQFSPPTEVMLQWRDGGGSFEHRAYWGANSIGFGTDGTNSRRFMGPLPPAGQWVRLAVPASLVGLEGVVINGIAYTLFNGRATWDQSGKFNYGTGPGYHFHPGSISQGINDSVQPVDNYLPNGLSYSGTAVVFVRLTSAQASEDKPDKFRGRFRGKKVRDYDATGNQIGYYFNAGPGLVVADQIRDYFHKRYYFNPSLADQEFWKRINWPSWRRWNDYSNNQSIPWDPGTGTINIARFDCHVSFLTSVQLADALDTICQSCGALYQDDGEQLIFLSPEDRAPTHHFHPGNMAGAPVATPRDLRDQPNYLVAKFRDYDDQFFGMATCEVKRDKLIDQYGERKVERELPPMHQSQAQRLLERMARIECDSDLVCTLLGDGSSIDVIPGDFVTVSHPVLRWEYQKCLVIEISMQSAEDTPDLTEFTLLKVDGPLYSDTAHGPRQEAKTA